MKVAVIGTGFGERVVAVVWRKLGCTVDVISPHDRDGVVRACADQVDLVSIHSPPFLHREHVGIALDHGRNILCDKPFGRDAGEAAKMHERARATSVLHFLNFEFRLHPARVKAKALLDAGAIGELRHISWTFIGRGLRNQRYRWLFDREQAGGWIGAYGSHAIDAMRLYFNDEIVDCGGVMRTETPRRIDRDGVEQASTAEDAYSTWFVMAGGGTVSMDTAYSSAVNLAQQIRLLGSDGAIEIVDDRCVAVLRPDGTRESHDFAPSDWDIHEPGLSPWLTAVRDAVLDGQQIAPSFADGLAVARVMDAMRARMTRLPPA